MICGVIFLRGGTFVAFWWQFRCFTLGGVGVSGGIIRNLLFDWLGGGGVILSRSDVAALMGGDVGATVMGGVVTLGNDGATLGGETGSCCDWNVARLKNLASCSNACI